MFDELTGLDNRKHFKFEADKIISSLKTGEKNEKKVSLSIGVATCGKEKSFDEIIKIADDAMYVAKKERER